jgi:hypothetical protein
LDYNIGMATTYSNNDRCPDYSSHQQNAADRLYPTLSVLSQEQDAEVQAEAEAEYLACEGHI